MYNIRARVEHDRQIYTYIFRKFDYTGKHLAVSRDLSRD